MKSILHNYYDKINCICLKERQDKYEFMTNQFSKHNLDVEFYRPIKFGFASKIANSFDFNKGMPNEIGAMFSHYHVIKTALLEGVEKLFVFEDDCAFHKDWDTLLPKYLETIPEGTDGILLYSFMDRLLPENIRLKPRWTKAYKSWSLLAYGMNKKAMETYINILDNTPMIADKVTYLMMENGFNFMIASPPLVIPSKILDSDIRLNKNYESTKSIFLLGINENDYA